MPEIRKTGQYQKPIPKTVQIAQALLLSQEVIVEHELTIKTQGLKIKELQPAAEYSNKVLKSVNSYTVTQIAKELQLSAVSLNRTLHQLKIQYKQNGTWVLYAKYQNCGYTVTNTILKELKDGSTITKMQTRWTERGRKFIHFRLNQSFQLPFLNPIFKNS